MGVGHLHRDRFCYHIQQVDERHLSGAESQGGLKISNARIVHNFMYTYLLSMLGISLLTSMHIRSIYARSERPILIIPSF